MTRVQKCVFRKENGLKTAAENYFPLWVSVLEQLFKVETLFITVRPSVSVGEGSFKAARVRFFLCFRSLVFTVKQQYLLDEKWNLGL